MKKYSLVVVLSICLLVIATLYIYMSGIQKRDITNINQDLQASSRNFINSSPGTFSIKSISAKCVANLPQVSLTWSQSIKASSYLVERMYPGAKSWEITGETSNLFFTDTTYEPGYDLGYFTYRVQAYNANGLSYSKSQKINIFKCPSVVPAITATGNTNSIPPVVTTSKNTLQWGAYVGDETNDLANFESLVGKKVNLYADFEGWNDTFPSSLSTKVGAQGKTLVIFWEPDFGYDTINNGSKDTYIKQFATGAKSYGYPIILAPFDEMNLNEEAWGYEVNNNTALKFRTAWQHIHDLFVSVSTTNVKFAITYNNVSIPDVAGNEMSDYYPGDTYVDYVGIDGFNFADPWQTFAQIFDTTIAQVSKFNKPIYILSMASEAGAQKASWITDGLGGTIKNYTNVLGWIWFNEGGQPNWIVNSDSASLSAFKSIIP